MSASEKLKGLDANLSEHIILRALPQIVAVVEAAERLKVIDGGGCICHATVEPALAALEEALS